jgi:acyl-CoA thioester hydrolase
MKTRTRIPLRVHDLDRLGHVNQAVYHELLEEARAAHLEPLGDFDFVLARVEIDFRKEVCRKHRHVAIVTQTVALGRSSVTVQHTILLPADVVAAEARSVLVAWNLSERRPRALSHQERAVLMRIN